MLAKLALPMTRLSSMRPATTTSTGVASSSSLLFAAWAACQIGGQILALKVVRERIALSAQRGQLGPPLGMI